MEQKKVLGFWDLVFFSFCAIFGVEAIAASAAIGPSAISWWLICIVGFFLPFGLIAAELGSTYPDQGGIYVWIKKAFGKKWAARAVWYYWIALPVWLPAMYIAIAEIISQMFFPQLSLWLKVSMGLVMIWVSVGVNLCPLRISKWVPNFGSITRLCVVAGMITTAIIYVSQNGRFANEITIGKMLPDLNAAIIFIPVIIYNLIGCELVSGAAGEMKNPTRDVPRAIILSAFAIAFLYLVTTMAVWCVVPIDQIDVASGIFQMFTITFRDHVLVQGIIVVTGILLVLTLWAEIITWNLGENRTVAEAVQEGNLPGVLGKMTAGTMAPVGASVISGIISSSVIIAYGFIARNASELFWHVISFTLIIDLLSYAMLFSAFIILRKKDKAVVRPYQVPGPQWFAIFLAVMAEGFVVMTFAVVIAQPGHGFIRSSLPLIVGVVIALGLGEIFIARSMQRKKCCA